MFKVTLPLLVTFCCAITLWAQSEPQKSPPIVATPAVEKNPQPIDATNIDPSVKPQDDFFSYANGGWIKRTEIPPEESRWGSFNQLIEKNNDALHEIAEKVSKKNGGAKVRPEVQKVGDYYSSGMDETKIDSAGTKPLAEEFKRIDAIKDNRRASTGILPGREQCVQNQLH